ncbi:MAG: ferrous iron transport protein A [Halorhodospira sp.]
MKRLQWAAPARERNALEQRRDHPAPSIETRAKSRPLPELSPGEQGVICDIDGHYGALDRLSALGLSLGTSVEVIRNPRRGPVLLQAHNTRVAVGRGQAHKLRLMPIEAAPLKESGHGS